MGLTDNLVSTLTGRIEKAVIRIADDRKPKEIVVQAAVNAKGTAAGAKYSANAKMNSLKSVEMNKQRQKLVSEQMAQMEAAGQADTDAYKSLLAESRALADAERAAAGAPVYDKSFDVQFNPSTLTLTSYVADEDAEVQDYKHGKGQMTRGAGQIHVELGVQLIFDRLVNAAAFSEDVLNYSPSGLIKNLGGMAMRAIEAKTAGEPNSVQVMVEGLTAALRNERTRRICFEWGKMSYSGILKSINANYTMFDREGRPVRAVVSMKIYLRDQTVTPTDQGYWEQAFKKAFKKSGELTTTKSAGQAVGSLLGGLY